jgi:hypothetical protein
VATYHCWSGGSNTAPYDTWAKAATTFTTAVGAASANGDVIKVHKAHTEELAADTVYTFLANVAVICVDKDAADAIANMSTAAWIGNSTTNRSVSIAGVRKLFFSGITFRTAGATLDTINIGADGSDYAFESCTLWNGNTNSSGFIRFGGANDAQQFIHLKSCTFRFGAAGQSLHVSAHVVCEGCTINSSGSAPTNLVLFQSTDPGGCTIEFLDCDLSHAGSGNLVGDATTAAGIATFRTSKLGTGYVPLAAQTVANRSGAEVWVFDCASDDTQLDFAYANAMGTLTLDRSIYFTSGAAALSWKIVTTANAGFYQPFIGPWISMYHTGTSAITPYFEILRDGSSTAYQDNQVWGEFSCKGAPGSTRGSAAHDRMTLLGSPANQAAGAGTGSWTGENATAWSGKIDSVGSMTPPEVGYVRGRPIVGVASSTVYVDPQIRT